jgi:hypothetical protein
VDDAADLHRSADEAVTGRTGLMDLERARIVWAQHTVERGRGPRPDLPTDTVITTLGAIAELLAGTPPVDPQLADALLALRGAADRLVVQLRTSR